VFRKPTGNLKLKAKKKGSISRIRSKSVNIWEAIIHKKQRRDNQKTENKKQKI
jgi:hypothetical protein